MDGAMIAAALIGTLVFGIVIGVVLIIIVERSVGPMR